MLTSLVTSSASHLGVVEARPGGGRPGRPRPSAGSWSSRAVERAVMRSSGCEQATRPRRGRGGSRRRRSRRSMPAATGRDHRGVAPRLAGVRVRQVQLDDRTVEGGQGVVDRPGVVGERAGVDDDGGAAAAGRVDGLDQLALVVGLQVLERRGRGARPRPWRWRRGRRAWRCRRPRARARRAGSGSAPTAAARSARVIAPPPGWRASSGAVARPRTGSTPRGPSSTNVMPSTAFLSRPNSSTSSSGSMLGRHGHRAGRSRPTTWRCSATRRRRCGRGARASSAA